MNDAVTFGAIFDVDGTLVDSHDAHFLAWKDTLADHGIEYDLEAFGRDFGRRNPEIIGGLWDELGRGSPDKELVEEIAEAKERHFRALLSASFPEMPGAADLIRDLDEAGWGVAIGSSAPAENVRLSIDLLGTASSLDAVVCGDDVERGKPEPDVFLEAAGRLGLDPRRCVVIEDACAGVEAAHRAGMPAVAIASKGRTRAELSEAELVIDSLEEIDHARLEKIIKETTT
ncbi:MAG: HAD family phosphatase [Phycisphaerales bacterium]|nr:HAD family phosphatase [Phycisphaerales bacterium]